MHSSLRRAVSPIVVAALVLSGCGVTKLNRELVYPGEYTTLDRKSPFLKVHLKGGDLLVLSEWKVDETGEIISGQGERQGLNRTTIQSGFISVAMDSVALFETNTTQVSGGILAMAVITGASLAATIYCLSNTKACFGSCPTFYVSDGKAQLLQAEGFSSSISPSLEARDIDALYRADAKDGRVAITMVNEALETHVVRHADLLAFPRTDPRRVVATSKGDFWRTKKTVVPNVAEGPEGAILEAIKGFDGVERYSVTDAKDLAAREELDLSFAAPPGERLGLVIASRQTLLSTYLFYQTLAYMGRSSGEWLARLERQTPGVRHRFSGLGTALGGIEVWARSNGAWVKAGEIQEHGPLAADLGVVLLPEGMGKTAEIKLRMTRGKHRLDYVALAALGEKVEPTRLGPRSVLKHGVEDTDALACLSDSNRVLITLPGDRYTLVYDLPHEGTEWELFLESRGYYLEWIREEWLTEEDPQAFAEILLNPKAALRRIAPMFKEIEPDMEDVFWGSRYGSP